MGKVKTFAMSSVDFSTLQVTSRLMTPYATIAAV